MEVRLIDAAHKVDINIPNEPFRLFGRMLPSYKDGAWEYSVEKFSTETELCFPDENYDYDAMCGNSLFIGAYEGEACVGLAILQTDPFKYMYLYDLKVGAAYRRQGVAKRLLEKADELAAARGYRGIYAIGQDNNLAACLFYVQTGFHIGGLNTDVYKGTSQEGKADIYFYRDCP